MMEFLTTTYVREIVESLNLLAAAALGAGFYSLSTSHRYVRDRTFDPQYNQLYVVRFVLGVAAGVILSVGIGESYFPDQNLGKGLLAIVGGYSADAVSEILQRLADTLLTIVKGSPDGESEAVRRADKAAMDAQRVRERSEARERLHQAKAEAEAKNAPQEVIDQIQDAIDSLE